MSGLGETTAMLRRRRLDALGVGDQPGPTLSEEPAFGANPGQLRMLKYSPADLVARAPLVIVLHGCGQSASAYANSGGWRELADQCGFVLIAPEQRTSNNPNRCFNWFSAEDATRGRGEAASIAAMIQYAFTEYRVDPSRVFITGLSAGGAMVGVMLATYPELFAAGAVVSGLPYGAALNVGEAMRLMRHADSRTGEELATLVQRAAPRPARMPRMSVWHGDADWTVNVSNGRAIAAQWASVLGLPEAPNETVDERGFQRSVWRQAGPERAALELNLVRAMGHGTPLSTGKANDVGSPGPFMLEVGISSTLKIAEFWGILDGRRVPDEARRSAPWSTNGGARPDQAGPKPTPALSDQVLESVSGHVAPKVLEVIEKALRMAGLKK